MGVYRRSGEKDVENHGKTLNQMCMDTTPNNRYNCIGTAAWRLGHSDIKGSDAMVTYEGLFAFGMLIIAVIALCYTVFKDRDK